MAWCRRVSACSIGCAFFVTACFSVWCGVSAGKQKRECTCVCESVCVYACVCERGGEREREGGEVGIPGCVCDDGLTITWCVNVRSAGDLDFGFPSRNKEGVRIVSVDPDKKIDLLHELDGVLHSVGGAPVEEDAVVDEVEKENLQLRLQSKAKVVLRDDVNEADAMAWFVVDLGAVHKVHQFHIKSKAGDPETPLSFTIHVSTISPGARLANRNPANPSRAAAAATVHR